MSFSQYFTDTITKALLIDPNRDVASINVDLKLSTLKPLHAKCMSTIYQYLLSPRGQKIISSGLEVVWHNGGRRETPELAYYQSWIHFLCKLFTYIPKPCRCLIIAITINHSIMLYILSLLLLFYSQSKTCYNCYNCVA